MSLAAWVARFFNMQSVRAALHLFPTAEQRDVHAIPVVSLFREKEGEIVSCKCPSMQLQI